MVNALREQTKEKAWFTLFTISAGIVIAVLVSIIAYLIYAGSHVINTQFLTYMWYHRDITKGGIFPAIFGSFLLAIGISLFSIPIGVSAAVYLNEYAKESTFTRIVRLAIRNLAGVPSIVYGMFGLAFFVLFLNMGTSLLAAALTLSCMTLPAIITASEEALKAVPQSFRDASYSLGATRWETIRSVVLPNSLAGMITGSILGVVRALGETAPIIMVGATFYMSYLPISPLDKFMALPYHLFILATQHASPHASEYAAGTALVLIGLIFIISIGAIIARYHLRKSKEW